MAIEGIVRTSPQDVPVDITGVNYNLPEEQQLLLESRHYYARIPMLRLYSVEGEVGEPPMNQFPDILDPISKSLYVRLLFFPRV